MTNSSSNKNNFLPSKHNGLLQGKVLCNRRDFLHVQNKGVRQVMPHFIIQAAMSQPSSVRVAISYRTGVTASKKVGNAVARNRAKRRMRALLRRLNPTHTLSGTDYVLVARHSLIEAGWAELTVDFSKAVKRIHQKLNETELQR
tara:strand:+ start:344 stop:775 length:432 start_codon:yes stop_codon:yes gene_type:complete